jgi:uncharacterized protein YajQ (UPF0234 family)
MKTIEKQEVYGTISFDVEMFIDAESGEEALKQAKKDLDDYFHLKSKGNPIVEGTVKINLDYAE